MKLTKILFIFSIFNLVLLSGANAQQGKALTDDQMFYCPLIGEKFNIELKNNTDPKMKELSSMGLAVYQAYLPFAKSYINKNKLTSQAIQSAASALDSQPLTSLIQPLLNCRDNPRNKVAIR